MQFHRRAVVIALTAALVAAPFTVAAADEHGTREEAAAMVIAAVDHVKKVGPEKAFKDFTADPAWKSKDLYVMAYDNKGTVVGQGANEKLVGRNRIELKDPNGVRVVAELTKAATTKGEGWVDYTWPHPQTKKLEDKSTYVRKLQNFDGWVGVGIYR